MIAYDNKRVYRYLAEIDKAAYEIGDFLITYGRIGVVQCKEKYGTARVYMSFGIWGFHSLINPGEIYSKWPTWLYNLDCTVGAKILYPLSRVIIPIQIYVYRLAYRRAIKKRPLLKREILDGADYRELLENL